MKTLKRIGLALEGLGATVTTTAAIQNTMWLVISGVIVSAVGRAIGKYVEG